MTVISYYLKRYPWRTAMVAACLLFSGVIEGVSIALLLPLLEISMGSGAVPDNELGQWVVSSLEFFGIEPVLSTLLLFFVAGIAIKSGARWVAMNLAGYSVAKVATDLRSELLSALMSAKWKHFVNTSSGYYSHALGIETKIASAAYQNLASAIACLIQLVIYVTVALILAWQTAALAILTALVIMVLLQRFVHASRRAGEGQALSMKVLVGRLSDALNTFKPVKAMAGEKELQNVLEKETWIINETLRQKVMAGETLQAFQEPIMIAVMAGGLYASIQWLGIPFASLMVQAFIFQRLVFQSNQLQRSVQSIANEEAALWSLRQGIDNAKAEKEPDTDQGRIINLDREVSLRSVDFSYGEKIILDQVTLNIPAGSFALLVGPSGTGKTTLLDMLAGLLTPQEGEILVDGVSLPSVDMQDWRSRIGYVAQEMGLLHDTVFRNVTLGDTSITRSDVEGALKEAGAWEFVSDMEEGMDSMVGERGAKISGGQRQRVALARALARRPRLLLLDEITASLDPDSEAAICKTLMALRGRITIVAISHQNALRKMADQILKLENGKIVPVEDASL